MCARVIIQNNQKRSINRIQQPSPIVSSPLMLKRTCSTCRTYTMYIHYAVVQCLNILYIHRA